MDVGPDSGGPEFPPVTREQWALSATEAQADVAAALAQAGSRNGRHWTIVQRVDDPDLERARQQIREDVEQGATGVALVFAGAPNAFGYGIPATEDALNIVLGDLPPGRVHVRIDAHPHSRTTAEMLAFHFARKRADVSKLNLSFGIDPAAIFAGSGALRMSIGALQASMPQSLGHFFALGAPGILLEADGRVFHNAGATEAQELGVMMASTALYLRMFSEARQPLVYATPHIGFSLSVDQNKFLSIAKLHALRSLWNKVQETFGLAPGRASIHAETSYRMMTRRDPETNILRSAVAGLAAATGGADTISVLPHTIAHGLADSAARRIARNAQIVMAEESHIGSGEDQGDATSALQALTDSLCTAAWAEFQTIESEGGVLQSLADGHIQKRIHAAREALAGVYRDRARTIVGTTAFPLVTEPPVTILAGSPVDVSIEAAATCERLSPLRIDELVDLEE